MSTGMSAYDVSRNEIRVVSCGYKGGRNTAEVIIRVAGKQHPETRHLREDKNGVWRDAKKQSYDL